MATPYFTETCDMLSQWLHKCIHRSVQAQCDLCRLPIDNSRGAYWCLSCQDLMKEEHQCARCGLPFDISTTSCGQCLTSPPLWDRLYCVGQYQRPLSMYIHKLKHGNQFWQARNLAHLLAKKVVQPPDSITSVPLHWQRHLKRGFNQSELLASELSKLLAVPLEPKLFSRVQSTKQQQGLSKTQRLHNVQRAFQLNRAPQSEHIAIVDDVVTTGATVNQLVKLLRNQNVKTIDIYCISRTSDSYD